MIVACSMCGLTSRATTQRLHYEWSQSFFLSRSTVAVYSLYSRAIDISSRAKNTAICCDLCFGVTARPRSNATALRSSATKPSLKSPKVAVRSQFGVTGP